MSIQEQKITEAAIAANGVQSQPDKLTGTAAQNKKVFDALVTAVVREKFNALLDELTGTGAAEQLGITTIPGFSADNIQTALEQIVKAMQDVTQGSVTDGSITLAKLAADALALINGKQPLTDGLTATTAGEMLNTNLTGEVPVYIGKVGDRKATLKEIADVMKTLLLKTKSITTAMLGDAVVTSEKLAALAVLSTHIAQNAVTAQKIAPEAVTSEKIAAQAIITALLAPNAVTAEKLANDIPYTKFGLSEDQVRHVYAGTTEPTDDIGSDGDIYLVYPE